MHFASLWSCTLPLNNDCAPNDSHGPLLGSAPWAQMCWRGLLNSGGKPWGKACVDVESALLRSRRKLRRLNHLRRVNGSCGNLALNGWWRSFHIKYTLKRLGSLNVFWRCDGKWVVRCYLFCFKYWWYIDQMLIKIIFTIIVHPLIIQIHFIGTKKTPIWIAVFVYLSSLPLTPKYILRLNLKLLIYLLESWEQARYECCLLSLLMKH